MPERWRAVLWRIEIEDLRPREIAPLLGLTPNAVSALAVRAREGLREAYLAAHLNKRIDLAPTCSDARKLLPSLIRGNASNRDQRMVKAHLVVCEDCSAVFSELSQVGLNLRAYVFPLVVGGATALGISAVGGAATGTGAVAGGTTVFGMATGTTAAASTTAAAGVGSGFAAGSVAAFGVSVGVGLTTVAVAASAAGLIPPIVAEDRQEKVAVQEAPAVPAPGATAVTTSPKIEAHQMFGDRATFDKYIVADTPKTEVPVAPKSPAPSATPTPAPVPSPSPTPSVKPTPSPKPVVVPTAKPSPTTPPKPVSSPEPIPEPTPEATVAPAPTPTSIPTSEASATPTPSPTPIPTPTPTPTPTPEPTPTPSDEPDEGLNAETVQISMQHVEGQSVPTYDFVITPAAPAQKYDLKLRFKHADVTWPDPTSNCGVKNYSFSGMSIFCVGEAVLRLNLIHVHDGQSIRFLMPSNPDFYREFELDD